MLYKLVMKRVTSKLRDVDLDKLKAALKKVDKVRLLKRISIGIAGLSTIAKYVKIGPPQVVAITMSLSLGGMAVAKALELIAKALEEFEDLGDVETDDIEDLINKHTDKYTDDDD